MKEFYEVDISGLKRQLPICKVNDDLYIAAFIMFGDVEITKHCAAELLKLLPADCDVLLTAEAKGIPLCYEMARSLPGNYVVARKFPKLYMKDILEVKVNSISTARTQTLFLDKTDVLRIKGKKVAIIDDVISTGDSISALETLVKEAGGEVAARLAVLAEGDAIGRDDIKYLAEIPLFNANGDVI